MSRAEVEAARHDPKQANVLYHDWESQTYDQKWSISYDERCITYAADRFRLVAGETGWPYGRALELGSGTGFFLLNLMQAGVATQGSVTDLSPGMVAAALRNAEHLGLDVDGRVADAERIPYADATFDLVVGHAVLHHIPDLQTAFRELHRVLKPGGVFFFAGEPSRVGDRIAAYPKRGAVKLSPVWRRAMGAQPADRSHNGNGNGNGNDHSLEAFVDVHAFTPEELAEFARTARFADVKVRGEELLANWFGWANRTFEASATPDSIPWAWRQYAYRGYLLLQQVDNRLLEPRFPARVFYNLMITGTKLG